MYRIDCSEIWGGTREINSDVCTGSLTASLFSRGSDGGKGGDIYYFSVCGRDMMTRIAIADVLGHGKAVSDTSHWLYTSLASRMNEAGGNIVLSDLNKMAKAHGYSAMTTAEVITFNKNDSTLYFSYAGHPPLLIKRQNENLWRKGVLQNPSSRGNIPLGVLENSMYDEESILLETGDALFLYTDGVTEAVDEEGHLFGLERLLNILDEHQNNNPHQLKQAVLNALLSFTGGLFKHDDVTLIAIKID